MRRVFAAVILLFAVSLPFFAEVTYGNTVRIGYFPEPGMMDGAADGAYKSGYGYEYIQELANYAGWKYEYVYGSFGELFDMVQNGELDMLPYVTRNEERAARVLFPDCAMGNEKLYLAALKPGRIGDDLEELQGRKIGTIKGAFYNAPFAAMLEEQGIASEFVEYPTPEARWTALENRDVDFSIESSTVCQSIELHVVYDLPESYLYYLVVSPERPDLLAGLNRAQKIIDDINPGFLDNLELKYFRGIALFKELSLEGREWLKGRSAIRIGTYDNDEPYVIPNADGTYRGIACAQVDLMLKALNIDLPVEWKLYPGKEQALEALRNGELDCINPYYHNYADAEADGVIISQTLYSSSFSVLYRGSYTSTTLDVIATPVTRLGAAYVRDNYPDAVIVPCQDGWDCLTQLDEGNANCVVMYTDALQRIALQYNKKHTLKNLSTDCDVCFAALPENAELISILNKAIPFVSDIDKSAIQDEYSIENNSVSFVNIFKAHPEYLYGSITVICLIILGLSHFGYQKERNLLEKQRENELYKSVVDNFSSSYEAVFLGNLDDGSYKVLVNKTEIGDLFSGNDTLAESARRFLENKVHPYDKEKIAANMVPYSRVKDILPVGQSDILEYRSITPDGYHWYRSTLNRLSENEILLGFKDCDVEIRSRLVEEKLMSEYDAIYIVDLIREEVYPSRSSRVSKIGAIREKVPYTPMVRQFAETVSPEYRQDWLNFSNIEFMTQYLEKEDHREYVYELPETKYSMRRFTIDVIERIDGRAAIVLFSFMAIDDLRAKAIIMQRKMAEQKILLDYFVGEYDSAYFVNLAEGTFEVLHMKHEFSKVFGIYGNTRESMKAFIDEHIHPADKAMMLLCSDPGYVKKRLKDSPSFSITVREEFDGVEKTMRCVIIRGSDEDQVACGFMDISEELRKERETQNKLEDALSLAESASRAKTTFLNNMSHDIRTPMNAIIGYTGLARKHIDNTPRVKDYLGKISQSGEHLLSLINDVLDMSRIESGNVTIEAGCEKLSDIINGLCIIVNEDMRVREHALNVEYVNVKDEAVFCDKLRLNQVLLNILSNANKYTPRGGGISLVVTEKASKKPGFAVYEFCVTDNGVGMSPEYLKTIFDPFSRAESSTLSGIPGTGLGMAITKNLVEMMDGTIEIISEEEKGTEVTITFEFRLLNADVAARAGISGNEAGSGTSGTEIPLFEGKKVLLVEDNVYNREIATEILEEYGLTVDQAADGSIAVDKIKAAKPGDYDLVLMDIQMPVMDGYEATRRIRALKSRNSEIPIVAMTANAFDEDRKMAFESGMNEHIPKPIDFDKLEEVMVRFLN